MNILKFVTMVSLNMILANAAFAKVNMATGQYNYQEVDFEASSQGDPLRFWRSYNSQSQYVGLFGRGWCTNIESRLVFKKSTAPELKWCHKTVSKFRPSKKGSIFMGTRGYVLKVQKTGWVLKEPSGDQMFFDKRGRLVRQLHGAKKKMLSIAYGKKGLQIRYGKRHLQLLTRGGRVVSGQGKGLKPAAYRYKGKHLAWARSATTKGTSFKYKKGRLHSIRRPNGTGLTLTFNKLGLIQQTLGSRGCSEKYRYGRVGAKEVGVVLTRKCGGPLTTMTYVFKYDKNNKIIGLRDKRRRRDLAFTSNGNILADKNTWGSKVYKYDRQGRVSSFTIDEGPRDYSAKFTWGRDNKVTRILYKGKGVKPAQVDLKYNRSGQPVDIRNSYGGRFQLVYKNKNLSRVHSRKTQVAYSYDKQDKLRAVKLKTSKNTIEYKLNSRKLDVKKVKAVGGFLDTLYTSVGPVYQDSHVLRGLL